MSATHAPWKGPLPVDGHCPTCGKWVVLALNAEPPQWACIDIDCEHGHGHPLRPAPSREGTVQAR